MRDCRLLRKLVGALALLASSAEAVVAQDSIEQKRAELSVLVPQYAIYPGDTITNGLIAERTFRGPPTQLQAFHTTRDDVVGHVARRTLVPGQPIARDAVRPPTAVQQGQSIRVVFQDGPISITFTGVALEAGAIGEAISVRNADTGRIIKARILGDLTVSVSSK